MSLPTTIGDVLAFRAARDPEAAAILCAGLQPLSFGALVARIREIGVQLRAAGLGPGSRVGIGLQRGPEAALLSVAVCCSTTLLPLNPNLSATELEAELKRVRLDALILPGDAPVPEWASAAVGSFGLFKVSKAVSSFDDIRLEQVQPVPHPRPDSPVTDQSWAAIFKTSGTTGTSKRVPVTHENLIEMARRMERWLKLTPADRSTCIMPIYYNAGFKATLLVPLLIGCSVGMPASTNPQDFDRWMTELQPTWLTSSPAFLQAIVEKLRPQPAEQRRHSLRFVLSTASYLPQALRAELESLLAVPVVEFYGMCEAGMVTAPAIPYDPAKAGSAGRIPEGELAIRGDDGGFLRPGQTGQVVLRGPSVMPGYLFDDIDGTPTGLQDGWLATGDVGTVDKDGFLTIVGRSKEIINRGGEKISPYDVEKALLLHPAVREAAAFAVPHPRLGENVGAAVVLHGGAEITSLQLIDFIYDRLAPFQMPRHIHIVDRLPVGATGKISRPQLSAAFAGHREPTSQPAAPLELQIAEIWQRTLKLEEIGIDDDFFEIGGDSLQATEMLLELEEITRYRIAPSEVRAQLTIRQLSETLAGAAAAKQELITKVRGGTGTPLFICHGDFCGWGFYAFRLAELLKADGPIYLLHSILDEATGIVTIEEMVRRYLPHVEAAAPSGPVRLAGYCHGGLAALEVAGCLERAGRTVENIVLVDTFSMNARPALRGATRLVSVAGRIVPGKLGQKIRRSGMPSLWLVAGRVLERDLSLFRRAALTLQKGTMRAWDTSRRTTYLRAMSKYLPPRVGADILCLLCDEYAPKKEYEAAAWKHLAPRVRHDRLPGDHSSCITSHVRELARHMNDVLAVKA
jgi:acyl-CoA synthetase (AMP-forming)/AMP-acid ligase II/thioesterase domain-containing protein/acyl carrier protein